MVRMDLRVVTIDVARQELMTRDNVPMTVDALLEFNRRRSSLLGLIAASLVQAAPAHPSLEN